MNILAPSAVPPAEAEIRAYAHQLYVQSGCVPGRDLENWLEAEAYLLLRARAQAPAPPDSAPQRATLRTRGGSRARKPPS